MRFSTEHNEQRFNIQPNSEYSELNKIKKKNDQTRFWILQRLWKYFAAKTTNKNPILPDM